MGRFAEWKFNGLYKADADKVYTEIKSIGEEATPAEIVKKAENKKTELHKCFTWDNDEAAEKYRLYEARQITHNLVFCPSEPEEEEAERVLIRCFNKTENTGGYKETRVILKNNDEYADMLSRAYAELHAFKAKYSNLTELQEIFDLIP